MGKLPKTPPGLPEEEDARSSGRASANPGARLLEAARELFAEQGYTTAGINEIIERSNTSKKSFYNYYPSKRDLGAAYLRAESQELLAWIDALTTEHTQDVSGFARAWSRGLKRAARRADFHGCPLANTAAQTQGEFQEILQETMRELRRRLERYLADCFPQKSAGDCSRLARQCLMQYEGAVQMWRLGGETKYFDLFAETMMKLTED